MKRFLKISLATTCLIGLLIGYVIYYFFFSMGNLPKGELVKILDSPDKSYTINLYLVNGGATTDFSIRGELINNKSASSKNIYWAYHESRSELSWVNDHTVIINGHELNVKKDKYDWRRN
ncbi:DUF5412 domain-containing protein [Paenibacillus chitinolyticus]|uniref:DUF5412 domain-containing protein n=1 Tax=Paenibacillus chitinolyticus TaxID=79263 RepID=UPI00386A9223